ncbi:DUF6522 family protein [Aurantimonas marianensis]|uniref:DUF6522 family protein n=1 Tax=Aurantimonas marianensis TaxID=2920428 RepID=A0A9X2H7P6_9HYPH|nr:DUF6522 family protein [Aurantimonas marianensis]MCP3055258.1 DUF6522 family protein [Aurantimonas marianensis]
MSMVTITADSFVVDVEILAEAFALDPATVRARMAAGEITSRCETGIDEDSGRFRLTFYHGRWALRLTLDAQGRILSRSTFLPGASQRRRV